MSNNNKNNNNNNNSTNNKVINNEPSLQNTAKIPIKCELVPSSVHPSNTNTNLFGNTSNIFFSTIIVN